MLQRSSYREDVTEEMFGEEMLQGSCYRLNVTEEMLQRRYYRAYVIDEMLQRRCNRGDATE